MGGQNPRVDIEARLQLEAGAAAQLTKDINKQFAAGIKVKISPDLKNTRKEIQKELGKGFKVALSFDPKDVPDDPVEVKTQFAAAAGSAQEIQKNLQQQAPQGYKIKVVPDQRAFQKSLQQQAGPGFKASVVLDKKPLEKSAQEARKTVQDNLNQVQALGSNSAFAKQLRKNFRDIGKTGRSEIEGVFEFDFRPPITQKTLNPFVLFGRAVDKADVSLKRFGVTSKDLAIVAGAGLAGGMAFALRSIIQFVGGTIKAASALEEQRSATEALFESNAELAKSFAAAATDIGLSERAALQAINSFGDLFIGLGLGANEALLFSTGLTALAADLASFKNITGGVEEASKLLISGLAGETEALRRLGIVISDADVEARILETRTGEVAGEVTALEKVFGRLLLIIERTAKGQGDFSRTSESLANALRQAGASAENARARLGRALSPLAADVVNATASALEDLSSALEDTGQSAGERFKSGLRTALRIGGGIVGGIIGALGGGAPAVAGAALGAAIGDQIARNIVPDSDEASAALQRVRDTAEAVGAGVIGVEALEEAILAFQAAASREDFLRLADLINEFVRTVVAPIAAFQSIKDALGSLQPTFKESLNSMKSDADAFSSAQERLSEVVSQGAEDIKDAEENLADVVEQTAERVEDARKRILDVEVRGGRAITDAQERVAEAHEDAADRILSAQERVQDAIERTQDAEESLQDAFEGIAEAERDLARVREDSANRIADAEERLARLLNRSRESTRQRRTREIQEAREAVEEARKRGAETIEDAEKRLDDAAKRRQEAEEQLTKARNDQLKAQENLEKAHVESSKRIAEAERELTLTLRDAKNDQIEAEKAYAEAIEDRTERIRDADEQLAATRTRVAKDTSKAAKEAREAELQLRNTLDEVSQTLGRSNIKFNEHEEALRRQLKALNGEGGAIARFRVLDEIVKSLADRRETLVQIKTEGTEDSIEKLRTLRGEIHSLGEEGRVTVQVTPVPGPTPPPFREHGGLARGLTLVGERGPELVNFRRPGQVTSNDDLVHALRGLSDQQPTVQNFNINLPSADPELLVRAVSARLGRKVRR